MANHHHGSGETSDLMTPKQVMELFQISKATLYAWVRRGVVPYVKLTTTDNDERGLLRFPRALILEWINKRKRGGEMIKTEMRVQFTAEPLEVADSEGLIDTLRKALTRVEEYVDGKWGVSGPIAPDARVFSSLIDALRSVVEMLEEEERRA